MTTTELAAEIAANPRFTGDSSAYFDELARDHGRHVAGLAWYQACLKVSQDN